MVIVYKISPLTYFMAKRLVKVDFIGMINILAGKEVAKELIQHEATGGNIAQEILSLLEDDTVRAQRSQELLDVKAKLGTLGASARAAKAIIDTL